MAELEKKWYVIRVAGGKEKKAKEYIENEIKALGLENYVAQILIPTEKIYQVSQQGKYLLSRLRTYRGSSDWRVAAHHQECSTRIRFPYRTTGKRQRAYSPETF